MVLKKEVYSELVSDQFTIFLFVCLNGCLPYDGKWVSQYLYSELLSLNLYLVIAIFIVNFSFFKMIFGCREFILFLF